MSIAALTQEFTSKINVISWENPNGNGVVGLVQTASGSYSVVELDKDGDMPFFEDFTCDERAEAEAHYQERRGTIAGRRVKTPMSSALLADILEDPLAFDIFA